MASQLEHLEAWLGEWETEAIHPMLPDTVAPGRITVAWLEGEKFRQRFTGRLGRTSIEPATLAAPSPDLSELDSRGRWIVGSPLAEVLNSDESLAGLWSRRTREPRRRGLVSDVGIAAGEVLLERRPDRRLIHAATIAQCAAASTGT